MGKEGILGRLRGRLDGLGVIVLRREDELIARRYVRRVHGRLESSKLCSHNFHSIRVFLLCPRTQVPSALDILMTFPNSREKNRGRAVSESGQNNVVVCLEEP